MGDAARYLDAGPKNIKRRQEIRAKGTYILRKLHDSGKYDRIIVVGHSLGTYIAYDILTFAWQEYKLVVSEDTKLPELDKMEKLLNSGNTDLKAYRTQQHKVFTEQAKNGGRWLVSDLITLGSPLTYADLLMAKDKEELIEKQQETELPTSPPQLDDDGKFSYIHKGKGNRKLHYAAMFAATRWTNIYFPPSFTIFGDVISGPLQHLFGWGIKDIPVKTKLFLGLMSHTNYWKPEKRNPEAPHIMELRKAINLLDK